MEASRRRLSALAAALLTAAALCLAAPRDAAADEDLRSDDDRLAIDIVAGAFGRYPGGTTDPGGALAGHYTVSATRGAMLGIDSSVSAIVGAGKSGTLYPGASLNGGGTLFLFDWLSLEVDLGLYLGGQLGEAGVIPVVGLRGSGAYRIHVGSHTFRLAMLIGQGFALAPDPGNDCPSCSGSVMSVGLGYEIRFGNRP